MKRLILIGDSLVADDAKLKSQNAYGWGLPLLSLIPYPLINLAIPGESAKSFWHYYSQRVAQELRKDDIVILSFAHNDSYPAGPHFISPKEHAHYLKLWIDLIRDKLAVPILVHPPKRWSANPTKDSCELSHYISEQKKLAKKESVKSLDIYSLSQTRLEASLKSAEDYSMYLIRPHSPDITHLSFRGAIFYAEQVAAFLFKEIANYRISAIKKSPQRAELQKAEH